MTSKNILLRVEEIISADFKILKYFTNFTKSDENNFVHEECENNSVEVKELTHVIMVSG